jgi:hypothetical protein
MSKYIQKVERCSFLISMSVKCVTRTTKIDNSVLPEPEIFSFITRFLLENRVFLHLKRVNHNNYGFLFRSEICFRTTRELEYLFFLSSKVRIFFPEFNIRLYDKNSESDFFFFTKIRIFFQQHWGSEYFFRKKP